MAQRPKKARMSRDRSHHPGRPADESAIALRGSRQAPRIECTPRPTSHTPMSTRMHPDAVTVATFVLAYSA
jgi:hypothetical protein